MKRISLLLIAVTVTVTNNVRAQNDLIFKNGFAIITVKVLNDTGMIDGFEYPSGAIVACDGSIPGPQDCHQGRDATNFDDTDGLAGFSFTKLDSDGIELDVSAVTWSCVKDNVTGLIWEAKTTDGSIHDMDIQYQWGGVTHIGNYGTFFSSSWDSLVNGSNSEILCGLDNWRVPSNDELISIVAYGVGNPSIDTTFFPNIASNPYWTASPYSERPDSAWIVGFGTIGYLSEFSRFFSGRVMLVNSSNQ